MAAHSHNGLLYNSVPTQNLFCCVAVHLLCVKVFFILYCLHAFEEGENFPVLDNVWSNG